MRRLHKQGMVARNTLKMDEGYFHKTEGATLSTSSQTQVSVLIFLLQGCVRFILPLANSPNASEIHAWRVKMTSLARVFSSH
jgi:hypothetical protein